MQLDVSFRRHLVSEQRGALLEALRNEVDPDVTVGDVFDAALALGLDDTLGEFSLQDLADALLSAPTHGIGDATAPTPDRQDADDGASLATRKTASPKVASKASAKKTSKASAKKTSKKTSKASAKKTPKASAKKTSKASAKKTSKKASKTSAKPKPAKKGSTRGLSAARRKALRRKLDTDEPMSLDEAAELLVPVIAKLEGATMQVLEESTGIGRRKLRFHIGQLVRHGYLERHGMGRGTYYSEA